MSWGKREFREFFAKFTPFSTERKFAKFGVISPKSDKFHEISRILKRNFATVRRKSVKLQNFGEISRKNREICA
jgi:hypothetical protein